MNPFGPIFRFELARVSRRHLLITARCAYAVVIALLVAAVYTVATKGWRVRTRPQDLAGITEGLFYGLMVVQFFIAVMIASSWTADAITSEKEKRTLPFLLATPLGDGEIVLGKLLARLARIGVVIIAGLPVLFALEFFGGVEPLAVVAGYVLMGVSVLSLGSLSLLCSVYLRTARAAGQRAARVVALYVVGLHLGGQLLGTFSWVANWPGGYVTVGDVVDVLNTGNPLALYNHLAGAIRGRAFGDAVPAIAHYALFHLAAAGVFVTWAIRRLRPVAAVQSDGPPPPPRTGLFRPPPRPRVGDRPVLWKALHFDFRQFRTAAGRAVAHVLFGMSFVPIVVTFVIVAYLGNWRDFPRIVNMGFVRTVGSLILASVLVLIASQASACIGVERRKQTLDDLLLTDLTGAEILAQKWWASIVVVRAALVWVGVHWVVAVVAGGLHPLAVPLMVVEWAAYASFAASLGVYWAAQMPTARAAGVPVGLIGFAAVAGPVVLGMLVLVGTEGRGGWFALPFGVTPPFALWVSAFTAGDVADVRTGTYVVGPGVVGVFAGVAVAAVFGRLLWRGAVRRFRR